MNRFNLIPETAFNDLILGAGILLKDFSPDTGRFTHQDIICATSGGIKTACTPKFIDLADGAENIRSGLAKFKMVDSWDASMTFTSLNASVEGLMLALGAADIDGDYKVTLAVNTDITAYFKNIWWVGARGDDGIVAMQLKNALSENGLEISTEDKGKGKINIKLTSQIINGTTDKPMEFYLIDSALYLEDETTGNVYGIRVENGNMVYADSVGHAKQSYPLIDSVTGEIYRVRIANGNLYYQKEE